jgi:hypothetical protein
VLASAACGGGGDGLETYDLGVVGYEIGYPDGWLTVTEESVTVFAETQEALDAAYSAAPGPTTALSIVFDHRSLEFLRGIGFEADPATPEALFDFNEGNFGWELAANPTETELFGVPAFSARIETGLGVSDVIQGIFPGGDEVFLLELTGPDEEALDAFAPTWELILGSVTASN